MILPTIHLNGSSKESLLDQLADAHLALIMAENTLSNCAPNARDYYPQGEDAFEAARQEFGNLTERLHGVRMEVLERFLAIDQL
jgi:hypothetical protein